MKTYHFPMVIIFLIEVRTFCLIFFLKIVQRRLFPFVQLLVEYTSSLNIYELSPCSILTLGVEMAEPEILITFYISQ